MTESVDPNRYRAPTQTERALFRRLAEADFEGSNGVSMQLEAALVRPIDSDGSLGFLVRGQPIASVASRIPVEGEYADADGVPVHVLLHVIDGVVNELEVYREDGGRPIVSPDRAANLGVATY